MKKFIAIIAVVSAIFSSTVASAQNKLVYDRSVNPIIGITVDNIQNNTIYVVKDQNGNVVKKGTVKQGGKIAIATNNLKSGQYSFEIMGDKYEFVIE